MKGFLFLQDIWKTIIYIQLYLYYKKTLLWHSKRLSYVPPYSAFVGFTSFILHHFTQVPKIDS